MRTSIVAVVGSLLMLNVAAADDRQWFVDALQRSRSGISETESYINEFTSTKNFPNALSLGTTSDGYRNIEKLEFQIDALRHYNERLTTYLHVLHSRVIGMNSLLADRQRDLHFKLQAADGAFRPIFLNLRSLNEESKASWMGRRELLLSQQRTIEQINFSTLQLRFAAHGFKEQLLAAGPFPEQTAQIQKDAAEKLSMGAADVNAGLLRLRELLSPSPTEVQSVSPPIPSAAAALPSATKQRS